MSERVTGLGPGSKVTNEFVRLVLPVAASDLVAWYPFRSGTGEDLTAGDSRFGDTTDYSASVNGATFKLNGGVTDIQTGANSGAFDFDGSDDTIDLGTVADSDQSLTVMAWVEPDTVGNQFRRVVTKADGRRVLQPGSVILTLNEVGEAVFIISGSSAPFILSPSSLTAGSYVHLAGRYDFQSGTATLFINGQPVATDSPGQAPSLSLQPWRIGADDPPGDVNEVFDGTMDDTRIYTAALSDSQINQIYLNTQP